MAPGSNDWEQYYPKSFTSTPMVTGGGIITSSVTTIAGDALVSTTDQILQTSTSPHTNGAGGGGGQLTPTGSVSKPIRRRSRVSKKTPITLLNANANNFRALVQQFTGCAASTAPISFGNQKGPINLSFGVSTASSAAAVMPPFPSYPYNNNNSQQNQLQRLAQQRPPLLQLQENHVQMHQEEVQQQRMYPFENNNNNNGSDHHVFHYSSNSISSGYNHPMQAGIEIGDEFEVMDQEDISLHELLD